MRIFNRKNLEAKRKHNRNNPTQAEAFLWEYLREVILTEENSEDRQALKILLLIFTIQKKN